MSPPGGALLERWLDRLREHDLDGLAALYAPDATIRAASETWRGRDEIEDGLTMVQRYLRRLAVEHVEAAASGSGLTFQTWIRGTAGRACVRHHWTLDGGRILGHEMELLQRGAVPAGA